MVGTMSRTGFHPGSHTHSTEAVRKYNVCQLSQKFKQAVFSRFSAEWSRGRSSCISTHAGSFTVQSCRRQVINMDPDSDKSLREHFRDFRRRVKGALRSSSPRPSSLGANSPSYAPSTQTLPTITTASGSVDPSPHAHPLTGTAISQHGVNTSHTPPAQSLPTTSTASSPRANASPSLNAPRPTTSAFQNAKEVGSVAWTGLETALRVLKESSDVFPPLKSAVSGLLACLDILQVGNMDSISHWRI
jgi:hypothetical protein